MEKSKNLNVFQIKKWKSNPAKSININNENKDISESIKYYVVWQASAMDLYIIHILLHVSLKRRVKKNMRYVYFEVRVCCRRSRVSVTFTIMRIKKIICKTNTFHALPRCSLIDYFDTENSLEKKYFVKIWYFRAVFHFSY